MPLGHLGVSGADLPAARVYYDRLLPALDYEPFFATDDEAAYKPVEPARGAYLFLYPAETGEYDARRPGLQHLAFIVRARSAVRGAVEVARELGSDVVHEPREFPEYPPPYFAAFWRDPWGLLLEVVCHHDRD